MARSIGQHEVTVHEEVHFVLAEEATNEGDRVEGEFGVLWGGDAGRRSCTLFRLGVRLLLGCSRGFTGGVVVAFVITGSFKFDSVGGVDNVDNGVVDEVTVVV